MKRIISYILSALFIMSIMTLPLTVEAKTYIAGDVNFDNKLDVVDIANIRSYVVGNNELSANQLVIGDVNADSKVNIVDIVKIRAVIVGNIEESYIDIADSDTEHVTETDTEKEETRGIWISYIEMAKYFKGKNEADFRTLFQNMINNSKGLGVNTLFIQVRSHGDACYKSELFPASANLSGQIGKEISYDALKIMTEMCHENGMKIHAWINPYRLCTETEMKSLSDDYIIKMWYNEGSHEILLNGRYYLNPASSGVISLVCGGISEILKYGVDGIQIDDYFYPSTDSSIDATQFGESGYTNLTDFRLDTISELVRGIYATVKNTSLTTEFGVSPQGNIDNDYTSVYADVRRWCSNSGFIDYIAPQIYFGFNNAARPYEKCAKDWSDMITNDNISLIIGLSPYKIGTEDKYAGEGRYEWINDEAILARQIESARSLNHYNGFVMFRYDSIFDPAVEVSSQVRSELNALVGIV